MNRKKDDKLMEALHDYMRLTTTEQIGRVMISVAKHGAPKTRLESADINEIDPRNDPLKVKR